MKTSKEHVAHARRMLAALMLPVVGLLLARPADAGPLVLEERTRIEKPLATLTYFGGDVALDGSSAIVTGSTFVPEPDTSAQGYYLYAALLFERASDGRWRYVRKLVEEADDPDFEVGIQVGMDNGVAAVSLKPMYVFERTASGWVSAPTNLEESPEGTDLEVDAGSILASSGTCTWDAIVARKAASGSWLTDGQMQGVWRGCDDEFRGGDADISGNRAIVFNYPPEDPLGLPSAARIYERAGAGSWPLVAELQDPGISGFGPYVALKNEIALVSGSPEGGTHVYQRSGINDWNRGVPIRAADSFMLGAPRRVEFRDGFVLQPQRRPDLDADVINVYQPQTGGKFRHVAQLVASDGASLGPRVDISGRTVIAGSAERAYVFELPSSLTQPALIQDTFQDGTATRWAAQPNSQFAVATNGAVRVYRQSSVAGNAAALLNNTNWKNQAIEADIKPTAFPTADRWFGLVARYRDAQNYYYVTVRSSNQIQLKRMVNGTFTNLASAPMTVTLNRNYRVRLEAIGSLVRVYVDGKRVLQARDTSLAQGQAGIMMYQTRADYDNVVATPNPNTVLYANDFQDREGPWQHSGLHAWTFATAGSRVYAQTSVGDGARSSIGVPTYDQSVQARLRATTFASGGERWFGLMARYRDDQNYYYVTLRNNNTLSLRKLVNGVTTVLATAPLTVSVGTWYGVRLDAIGSALRVYVNGQLLLEGADTTHATGTYGVAMYKTAMQMDDFIALQP